MGSQCPEHQYRNRSFSLLNSSLSTARLNWRTGDCRVRTIDATVAGFGLQDRPAMPAIVELLTDVTWHRLRFPMAAFRADNDRLKYHCMLHNNRTTSSSHSGEETAPTKQREANMANITAPRRRVMHPQRIMRWDQAHRSKIPTPTRIADRYATNGPKTASHVPPSPTMANAMGRAQHEAESKARRPAPATTNRRGCPSAPAMNRTIPATMIVLVLPGTTTESRGISFDSARHCVRGPSGSEFSRKATVSATASPAGARTGPWRACP